MNRFEKLAETINVRDDVKLAHVNCDNDKDFCETLKVKGNKSKNIEIIGYELKRFSFPFDGQFRFGCILLSARQRSC